MNGLSYSFLFYFHLWKPDPKKEVVIYVMFI